jgi:hypothetical protein
MKTKILFLLLGFLAVTANADDLKLDPNLGKVLESYKAPNSKGDIWILKQWHLPPNTNTQNIELSKTLPQYENQKSLFLITKSWIESGKVKVLVSEGCSGELTAANPTKYNGWAAADLLKKITDPSYVEILTHVPLKLEVLFAEKLRTICGDDDALIRKSNMQLSEARGTAGFLGRIREYKNDPAKLKSYKEKAESLFRIPPGSSTEKVDKFLRDYLSTTLKKFMELTLERNKVVVNTIEKEKTMPVVVIYGGLHASGIASLLKTAGYSYHVIEPKGYSEAVLKDFEKLLSNGEL